MQCNAIKLLLSIFLNLRQALNEEFSFIYDSNLNFKKYYTEIMYAVKILSSIGLTRILSMFICIYLIVYLT